MRAYSAILVLTNITVVAKDLKLCWESFFNKPLVKAPSNHNVLSVPSSVIQLMIDTKEGLLVFTATGTNAAIVFVNQLPSISVSLSCSGVSPVTTLPTAKPF